MAPCALVLGTTLASIISGLLRWPWPFWLCSITCFSMAVAGMLSPPAYPAEQDIEKSVSQKIDVKGGSLGIIRLILVSFSPSQGPIVGW